MKTKVIALLLVFVAAPCFSGEYLGQLSRNKYNPDSIQNNGNDHRVYSSMRNKYSSGGPRVYNGDGEFRGNLNGNRYDPDSVSNPYGRYGSKYSPDSMNNPYGEGSRFNHDGPNSQFGDGWSVYDD